MLDAVSSHLSAGSEVSRPAPTLETLAERAGVSRATASRVMRGATNVSDEARRAVLAAAEELAYTPNRAARSLVTRRSDSVAFVVAENEDRLFGDPFFLDMLRSAQTGIAAAGLQLVFVIASNQAEARQFERYAGGGHIDGVLLLSLHGDDQLPQHLERLGVPTVLLGRPMAGADEIHYVDSDNVGGGRTATELLLARGARTVATITGPMDMAAGQDRLAGYRAAIKAAGVRTRRSLVVEGDFTIDGGRAALVRLLHDNPDLDAVFAASDLMAIGALRALADAGRRVPDDVAVVGYDDHRLAALANPALTTVRQPIAELGRAMADMLLARIEGVDVPSSLVLPTDLVQRDSA